MVTSPWYAGIVPVISALLGLLAGLLSPMIVGGLGRRDRRRMDQRARCDEVFAMFREVNVTEALRDPWSGARRSLLLTAVRIRDEHARDACTTLVEYCSRDDATDQGILDRWTTMVDHIARVYRAAS